MHSGKLDVDRERVTEFCRRWMVEQLSIFGSALRADFAPTSDVDILVVFAEDAPWDLLDIVRMEQELARIFQREVDLVERQTLKNPFRRKEILSHLEVLYAA